MVDKGMTPWNRHQWYHLTFQNQETSIRILVTNFIVKSQSDVVSTGSLLWQQESSPQVNSLAVVHITVRVITWPHIPRQCRVVILKQVTPMHLFTASCVKNGNLIEGMLSFALRQHLLFVTDFNRDAVWLYKLFCAFDRLLAVYYSRGAHQRLWHSAVRYHNSCNNHNAREIAQTPIEWAPYNIVTMF